MPAASFYPLILACLLPPLTLFAVLRLCWFFGSRFGYAKNAVFLLIAAVLAGLVLLAISTLMDVEWRAISIWMRVPAVLGLYLAVTTIAGILWFLFAVRDRLVSKSPAVTNWLTGLSFLILILVALFGWAHGFGQFTPDELAVASLAEAGPEMLALRRFDLISIATLLMACMAFGEARRFDDQTEASGISDAWRIGIATAFISVFGDLLGSGRLSPVELSQFAADRSGWQDLSGYQLVHFLEWGDTIWQRDATGCLALLSIGILVLFHGLLGTRLFSKHPRAIGACFGSLSSFAIAAFAFLYPGSEFRRDPTTDLHLSLMIGTIGGAILGILMPEMIHALARWRLSDSSPTLVKVITPPWLTLLAFFLVIATVKLMVPRSSASGNGYLVETAIQFGIFSFTLLWAIRYGIRAQASQGAPGKYLNTDTIEARAINT